MIPNTYLSRLETVQDALDEILSDGRFLTRNQRDRILSDLAKAFEHYYYYRNAPAEEKMRHYQKFGEYYSKVNNDLYKLMEKIENSPFIGSRGEPLFGKQIRRILTAISIR